MDGVQLGPKPVFAKLMLACAAVLAAGCGQPPPTAPTTPPDAVTEMRRAMALGNWQRAREHSRAALLNHPGDPEILADAAMAAANCDQKREAAQLMADAATAGNYRTVDRVDFAVQALVDVGEIYDAIDLLERSLQVYPDNSRHRRTLLSFLGEAQRIEKIEPHYRKLIQDRKFDFPVLLAFTESSTRRFSVDTSKTMMERNPDDYRIRLGEAQNLIDYHDANGSREVLDQILKHHPNFAPAHALLGQILVAQLRTDEISDWMKGVPSRCTEYVDYWLTLGDWASERDQLAAAARAYWEATRRDSNDISAWTRLAQTLRQLQRTESSLGDNVTEAQLADIDLRLAGLMETRKQLFNFEKSNQTSQTYAVDTAKALAKIGRLWEAEAWAAAATLLTEDPSDDLTETRTAIVAQLREFPSWVSEVRHPSLAMDLSSLPLPSVTKDLQPVRRTVVRPRRTDHGHVVLAEETEAWGLTGIGSDNNPDNPRLGPLIRSTGVGVARSTMIWMVVAMRWSWVPAARC